MESIERILQVKKLPSKYHLLSNKDGVKVMVLLDLPNQPILKYFENKTFYREIEIYKILSQLNILTIPVIRYYDDAVLLANMNRHDRFRLATSVDLNEKSVVVALANWYKDFHTKGKEYCSNGTRKDFYSEMDLITLESLSELRQKSGYNMDYFWDLFHRVYKKIYEYYLNHQTFTYNDFFYGNTIVSKDLKTAFMYDYNMVGLGFPYLDLQNVLFALTDSMQKLFLETYGDLAVIEKMMAEIISPIVALIMAYKRKDFPLWALDDLSKLRSNELLKDLEKLNHFLNDEIVGE